MPPKKKQKAVPFQEEATLPVVFKSPGLKPDVRLAVFGQEFHVHSIILKLHSNYFRRFLDSPEKAPAPATAAFKYDYISVVDDDGEWGLEVVSEENRDSIVKPLANGCSDQSEISAMQNILCAVYNKPYVIASYVEFANIVRLADFYCALPIVSSSLYTVLWNSPKFVEQIQEFPDSVLRLSKKLRHPILFRESLVHVVSDWPLNEEQVVSIKDDEILKAVIIRAHSGLCQLLLKANFEFLEMAFFNHSFRDYMFDIAEVSYVWGQTTTRVAKYFRKLLDKLNSEVLEADFAEKLLKSKLVLNRELNAGVNYDTFLCASVADEDLPWDSAETDF